MMPALQNRTVISFQASSCSQQRNNTPHSQSHRSSQCLLLTHNVLVAQKPHDLNGVEHDKKESRKDSQCGTDLLSPVNARICLTQQNNEGVHHVVLVIDWPDTEHLV